MAVACKDGAWITLTQVTKVECTKCGVVVVTKYPTNDREDDELIREHLQKHGGRA